ncbi:unnamed protein product [Ilex paraguariensis]|uniref:Uncharacterized protein n=1 Tax=Ilex paraguariensis TaxID=185542 RepID=A0ABC8QSZ9_9AQUA
MCCHHVPQADFKLHYDRLLPLLKLYCAGAVKRPILLNKGAQKLRRKSSCSNRAMKSVINLKQTFAGAVIEVSGLTIDGICIRYIWSCSCSCGLPHYINGDKGSLYQEVWAVRALAWGTDRSLLLSGE